ncbi:hypothetical protein T440DRAFT_142220 [Plenodomus tracheiphilus IPT5]|uniref:Uncharacterized protein n=1 Tax=Plenodomus tracheiphilus IPT5 TaxID=1408161 RepID=A0A6A7B085_9PLEO|nr:hypothetical protein T440DRAFT_142220 [Plenodomus tracheiphilus IPT5]
MPRFHVCNPTTRTYVAIMSLAAYARHQSHHARPSSLESWLWTSRYAGPWSSSHARLGCIWYRPDLSPVSPNRSGDIVSGSAELQINGERRDRAADPSEQLQRRANFESILTTSPSSDAPCSLSRFPDRCSTCRHSFKSKHGARLRFRLSEHHTSCQPARSPKDA